MESVDGRARFYAALLTACLAVVPISPVAADAIADLTAIIVANPNNARAFYDRGNAYADQEDYDRAIADYDETIRLDPKFASAFNKRALAYDPMRTGHPRAIADYSEAIRLDPGFSEAFRNRGYVYQWSGQLERARADLNEAIRLNPMDVEAFIERGNSFEGERASANYEEAIRLCTDAIQRNPNDAVAFYWRGRANFAKDHADRAISDYNEAIRIDPNYREAIFQRGLVYHFGLNRRDFALGDFNEAIRLRPRSEYHRMRAVLYGGDTDRVIAEYSEAIRINARDGLSFSNRGFRYLHDKKDFARAISDYSEAIRLYPSFAAVLNRGHAYFATKDFDRAIADYTEAIRLDQGPDSAIVYAHRASAWRAKGDLARAAADEAEAAKRRAPKQ